MGNESPKTLWERALARMHAGEPPPNAENPPRRHHYVPQMYLERFADCSGGAARIARIDASRGPSSLITLGVRDAAVETDFYVVDVDDPKRRHEAEHLLGLFEATAGHAFANLDRGGPDYFPDEADRESLALFMAAQFSRVHDTGEFQEQLYTKVTGMVMRASARTPDYVRNKLREQGEDASDEAVERICSALKEAADSVTVTPHRNETVAAMLSGAIDFFPYFFKRRWVIACSSVPILTSDRPVALVPSRHAAPWEGVGVGTAETIIFPVDRRRVLLMRHPLPGHDEGVVEIDATFARQLNTVLANNARRWLFHHPGDRPLDGVPFRGAT